MKTQTTENQIHQYGWEIERIGDCVRAAQGGFKTLWRPSLAQCLQDVRKIVEARKDPANVPF
jgi:hypothetical protein